MSVEIEQIVEGSVTFQESLRLRDRFESSHDPFSNPNGCAEDDYNFGSTNTTMGSVKKMANEGH